MNILNILRKLVEYQQYSQLEESCHAFLGESGDPAILPLLALAYAQLGIKEKAGQTLRRAQKYQEDFDAPAKADLAAVLIVMQRFDEAGQLLNQALAKEPQYGLAMARLALCRMADGELDASRELLEQAAVLEPRRIAILTNLAQVYVQQSDHGPALGVVAQGFDILELIQGELPEDAAVQLGHCLTAMQLQIWVADQRFACIEQWLQEQSATSSEDEFTHWLIQYSRLLAEMDLHQQAVDILWEYMQKFPDNIAMCLQVAELARVLGYFMQAVRVLRKALAVDKENIALWCKLSSVSLHRFDRQARKSAEKAVELAQALQESEEQPLPLIKARQGQAKSALALVESHEQNYDTAEKMFREILTEHQHFIPALKGLGQQQMQRGNIEEAIELFERIRQIDPVKGQSVLINARRFPEDEQTLVRMEKAAAKPSLEGRVCSGILFNLAAAREKRCEYDRAMDFAYRANEATRQFLSYDAGEHRNKCARIREMFSKSLFDHRRECGHDATLPVYVLGMPRSGTTLVEQIIAGHSKIFGAGELGVIPGRIQGLNRWERHVGSGRQYPDCIDDLSPYITEGIAKGILEELREMAEEEKPGAEYVVDKLPHNFENIGFIKFLFPNAKIISVRRDPRDIAISNYFTDYQAKHGGMGFAYDLTHIGEQLADHNLLMHHWNQILPGRILEINYEDVIQDLAGSARRMLDYIGVEWEPSVLRFNELERPVKTASVWQVRQPIYKTSKGKWKRYENHLAPLIKGTNAKIQWDPIDDTITLPEPALLQDGVALYEKGDLAKAELNFKKMLHHNPAHAACNYMVGLIYCSIGHISDAIPLLEKALEKCPWQKEWRANLIRAYEETGQEEKLKELRRKVKPGRQTEGGEKLSEVMGFEDDTIEPTTREITCTFIPESF